MGLLDFWLFCCEKNIILCQFSDLMLLEISIKLHEFVLDFKLLKFNLQCDYSLFKFIEVILFRLWPRILSFWVFLSNRKKTPSFGLTLRDLTGENGGLGVLIKLVIVVYGLRLIVKREIAGLAVLTLQISFDHLRLL